MCSGWSLGVDRLSTGITYLSLHGCVSEIGLPTVTPRRRWSVKADVSIVVCTYNRADMLGRALESLVRQETHGEFRFEIVVVDDGSTDGTQVTVQNIAKDCQVPIRCLRKEGRGIAAARNTGVKAASGPNATSPRFRLRKVGSG